MLSFVAGKALILSIATISQLSIATISQLSIVTKEARVNL